MIDKPTISFSFWLILKLFFYLGFENSISFAKSSSGHKKTPTQLIKTVSVDISEVSYCYINNLPISLECLYRILGIWHHQSLLLILVLLKFED